MVSEGKIDNIIYEMKLIGEQEWMFQCDICKYFVKKIAGIQYSGQDGRWVENILVCKKCATDLLMLYRED